MSAAPTLYYINGSPPARAVLLVAKALDLELNLKLVNLMTGEHTSPEFLKMNPQHTVPTLDDNGQYLWDSHAIATYLIGKYGNSEDHPLYPKDLYTRARIDQRLHFETGILFPSVAALFRSALNDGAVGVTDQQLEAIHSGYTTLETFLGDSPYLVGDHLTVADLSVITTLTQLATQVPLNVAVYPNVVAWVGRLEALPYFHETNTVKMGDFLTVYNGLIARNKAALE